MPAPAVPPGTANPFVPIGSGAPVAIDPAATPGGPAARKARTDHPAVASDASSGGRSDAPPDAPSRAGEPTRLERARQAIGEAILRRTGRASSSQGTELYQHPSLPTLSLFACHHPVEKNCAVYEPGIAVIVQGDKQVMLGSDTYRYGTGQFLVTSLNLPTVSHILAATPQRPFLGLFLSIDLREIGNLLLEGHLPPAGAAAACERAMSTGQLDHPLMTAFQRLVELLDEPSNIAAVAPLIRREILYRVLVSDQGERLRQIGSAGSQSHQIARAIDWLKAHYASPLRIEELAGRARMSTSTFHHHFRALTAMSPLQYQKWLRLNEARRLMLTDRLDASTAAFRVGYESASQFSREYSRQFGAPPVRDITRVLAVR